MPLPGPLVGIFECAAASLSEDLGRYWPSTGKNDVPEGTPALHLGAAFKAEGWRLYGQLQFTPARRKKLDLFAFHPKVGIGVAVKCTRFFPKTKSAVFDDWARLDTFRLQQRHTELPRLQRSFRAVFGTSFYPGHVKLLRADPVFTKASVGWQQIQSNVPAHGDEAEFGPQYLLMIVDEVRHHFR